MLHAALELLAHSGAVPAPVVRAPSDDGAIALHGCEGPPRGVDLLHAALELLAHRQAVTATVGTAPSDDEPPVGYNCECTAR